MPDEKRGPGAGSWAQVLTDQVFDAILAQLLDNEVPPGSSRTIDRLARDFGVSITPVREALARLETTGMVRREDLDQAQAGGDAFADWRPYWNADEAFHRRIAEAVGSDAMLRMYLSTEGYTQRFRLLVHNQMSGEHTVKEHRAIVDAARDGSPGDARRAMLQHIEGITRRALELPMFTGADPEVQQNQ